jgi:hypothetical protein
MKEDKKISQADIDNAKVQLGPLAGIPVRVYLPVIYALLLLVILFLFLILPGISKYGSYLEFDGQPSPAAVYSEGNYKGSSEQSIFFPAGTYKLNIEHEGFGAQILNVKVGGRLFGSLFFPRKQSVAFGLKTEDAAAYLQKTYAEYSAWSMSGKPSALYQIPTVISEAVSNLASTGALYSKSSSLPTNLDFARDVASASASAESARDGLRASFAYTSSGIIGPLSLANSARTIVAALGSSAGFPGYAQDLAPGLAQRISKILGQTDAASTTGDSNTGDSEHPAVLGKKYLTGHEFIIFSQGSLELESEAPSGSLISYTKTIAAFGLAATEVTNRQWARFLNENPQWQPANKAVLIERGWVDEDYLAAWNEANDLPVTGVSWFAASAYCDWLSTKSGSYRIGLPSEAMWEAAARAGLVDEKSINRLAGIWSDGRRSGPELAGGAGYDKSGIADLFGNVWEWSSDSYRPYPAFAIDKLKTAERSVRGGSWANKQGSVSPSSRGGLQPARCTPYLGFRPALLNP